MEIKDKEITFRTEIEFKGSIAEFGKMAAVLKDQPIDIGVEWPPDHIYGCWPIGPQKLLRAEVLQTVTKDMPRFILVETIHGGIRDPHLHIGNEVVLLGRERFKELVGQVAMRLAGDLAAVADHQEAVGAIRNLVREP